MLSNAERKKLVLDLYNQGKNIHQIAKEARMSFPDINTVLKKVAASLESETNKSKEMGALVMAKRQRSEIYYFYLSFFTRL
jgi:Mor family transcriptional regulator